MRCRTSDVVTHPLDTRTQKDGRPTVVVHLLYQGILTIRLRADHLTNPLDNGFFVRKLIGFLLRVDDRSIHRDLEDAARGGQKRQRADLVFVIVE